jgi:hypothetical protein
VGEEGRLRRSSERSCVLSQEVGSKTWALSGRVGSDWRRHGALAILDLTITSTLVRSATVDLESWVGSVAHEELISLDRVGCGLDRRIGDARHEAGVALVQLRVVNVVQRLDVVGRAEVCLTLLQMLDLTSRVLRANGTTVGAANLIALYSIASALDQ